MDTLIKDYLDMDYFNWQYIKEHKEEFLGHHQELDLHIDQSDCEAAYDES